MGHQHHWRDEPPEGKLYFNKTFDERYGDEEDMATNSMLTSPEELQRLRCTLAKNPDFVNSPSWPKLTEWCSSCNKIRLVRLALPPQEEKVSEQETTPELVKEEVIVKEESTIKAEEEKESCDACTQTPVRKPRRRSGQGSRRRRMLAFQLMLTQRRGLPLSRLLKEAGVRSSKERTRRLIEESASPVLKGKRAKVKEEKNEHEEKEKNDVRCKSAGVSAGESTLFTPRSSQSNVISPSSHPFPQMLPFFSPCFPPPPSSMPYYTPPQCGQMPWPQWVICGAYQSWGTVLPCAVLS